MHDLSPAAHPGSRKLSVLAYELNSLALAVAAEAATLARRPLPAGPADGTALADEMSDLIRHLQAGTKAIRVARHSGV